MLLKLNGELMTRLLILVFFDTLPYILRLSIDWSLTFRGLMNLDVDQTLNTHRVSLLHLYIR